MDARVRENLGTLLKSSMLPSSFICWTVLLFTGKTVQICMTLLVNRRAKGMLFSLLWLGLTTTFWPKDNRRKWAFLLNLPLNKSHVCLTVLFSPTKMLIHRLCSQSILDVEMQAGTGRDVLRMLSWSRALTQSRDTFTGCGGRHSLSSQTGSCTCQKGTEETWCTFHGTDPLCLRLDSQFLALRLVPQL